MNWKIIVLTVVMIGALPLVGGYAVSHILQNADFARTADDTFGDQNLKTAVALVELHKVRYGRYPADLRDLKYTGEWDKLPLSSVRYVCNAEGSAYHLEVSRGWIGKPHLEMPEEF